MSENKKIPKHELISEKDADRIIKGYNITKEQLPKIRLEDPAINDMKAKIGDVIKITRQTQVGGETIYYRAVIE
ncbi:MAG: DNA-directed RNA polymerase subunit H [Candidatus Altiarchaeota archaeon]